MLLKPSSIELIVKITLIALFLNTRLFSNENEKVISFSYGLSFINKIQETRVNNPGQIFKINIPLNIDIINVNVESNAELFQATNDTNYVILIVKFLTGKEISFNNIDILPQFGFGPVNKCFLYRDNKNVLKHKDVVYSFVCSLESSFIYNFKYSFLGFGIVFEKDTGGLHRETGTRFGIDIKFGFNKIKGKKWFWIENFHALLKQWSNYKKVIWGHYYQKKWI